MASSRRLSSSSLISPRRSLWLSTSASPASRRRPICSLPISRLKTPTVLPAPAACCAMLKARVLLPMLGRAASHDQVGAVQSPSQQLVEVGESGRHRSEMVVGRGLHGRALLHVAVEHVPDVGEVPGAAPGADAEDCLLGAAQRVVGVGPRLVPDGGDLSARVYDLAHHGGALDDPGVVLDVHRSGHHLDEMGEVGRAADPLEPLVQRQLVGDRHLVDRLAPVEQGKAGLVAPAVLLAVEVARLEEGGDPWSGPRRR